jgi:hypothetical protein
MQRTLEEIEYLREKEIFVIRERVVEPREIVGTEIIRIPHGTKNRREYLLDSLSRCAPASARFYWELSRKYPLSEKQQREEELTILFFKKVVYKR